MEDKQNRIFEIPPLVAHRGASHYAPENTMPAYRLAWQEGADRIEGDFWLTADGEIVCHHDRTTARTATGQNILDVTTASLKELQRLDVGAWKSAEFAGTRIPTLAEILSELPPDGILYVEVKQDTPKVIATLEQVVADSPATLDQVMLIAFSSDIIRQAKQMIPQMRAFLLSELEWDDSSNALSPPMDELFELAKSIWADGLGMGNSVLIDRRFVEGLRQADLEFHAWTVNSADEALRYMDLGVDSLTTDRPQGLRVDIAARLGA